MRLILIGCEYSGGSTMSRAISEWLLRERAGTAVRIHDHWVYPNIADQGPFHVLHPGSRRYRPGGMALQSSGQLRQRGAVGGVGVRREGAEAVAAGAASANHGLAAHAPHGDRGGRFGQHPGRPPLRGGGVRPPVLRVRPGQLFRTAAAGRGSGTGRSWSSLPRPSWCCSGRLRRRYGSGCARHHGPMGCPGRRTSSWWSTCSRSSTPTRSSTRSWPSPPAA